MIVSARKAEVVKNGVTINDKAVFVTYDDGEVLCVPTDPTNRHYAEVLRLVDAGELTIADAD